MRTDGTTSLWLDRPPFASPDAFVPGSRYDVVVAGAGLTGMVTAVLLARAGKSVAVLEARTLGAVTTGNTTGKISLLQGTQLSKIARHHPDSLVTAYLDSNRAGQDWLLDWCAASGVAVQRASAYSYAGTSDGTDAAYAEFQTARTAGLPVRWTTEVPLPFETFGAATLDDQAQFDPIDALVALAAELRSLGGVLVEHVRLTDVDTGDPCTVTTDAGDVTASAVVLATGVPVLDRGLYFAKVIAKRSYAAAFRAPGPLPQGLFLSVDVPSRSLRIAPREDGDVLVIGGNGHDVGREDSPMSMLGDLEQWTRQNFPGAETTHTWSAQDYESANSIPFVGWLPRGRGRIFMATGYDKWGMTNGVAAGIRLAAEITDAEPASWAAVLGRRMTTPADLAVGAKENVTKGVEATTGWLGAAAHALPDEAPEEGAGIVGRKGIAPVAVSTVDGKMCAVSAICPHLGGIVTWNDAELSWDCPLHGSRFDAGGTLLEGPATSGLAAVDAEVDTAS